MSDTYVVGKTVEEFNNSTDKYIFALRRTEDGDLYLLKANLTDSNEVVELFGEEVPAEFQSMDIPGSDYFDGRAQDHTLEYTTHDVKYEQWKWVNRTQSYFIDSDGFFTIAIGEEKHLPQFDDIRIPNGHSQQFTIVGNNYNINLYNMLIQMGWNGVSEVTVTNNGNIYSSQPTDAALVVDQKFLNGITIINNGNIIGCNGSLNNNPTDNRNFGLSISVETTVDSFVNNGTIKAGNFNGQYANVFRGYSNIVAYSGNGTWIGYDD